MKLLLISSAAMVTGIVEVGLCVLFFALIWPRIDPMQGVLPSELPQPRIAIGLGLVGILSILIGTNLWRRGIRRFTPVMVEHYPTGDASGDLG